MATQALSVQVSADVVGLDRTKINSSGQVQLIDVASETTISDPNPNHSNPHSTFPESTTQEETNTSSKRHCILQKTKKILHVAKDEHVPTAPVLADARDMISDARLEHEAPVPETHSVKDFLHHPASTVRSTVAARGGHHIASNLAAKEISHGTDVEVVRAEVERGKDGTGKEEWERRKAVDVLLRERQDMFVRWNM